MSPGDPSSEEEPTEVEESTTNDQEPEEEIPEPPKKIIKTSKTVAEDYEKMCKILQKQTGIKNKDLEGMSPKEKFDRLSFFAEHSKTITKNQKIVPDSPIGVGDQKVFEGMKLIDHPITGRKTLAIDPKQLFQNKK